MFLFNEIKKRYQIARDTSLAGEKRLFAALELFCGPLSLLTIFVLLPTMILLEHFQVLAPNTLFWLEMILRVLLAAAVGYLTNTIALEMLFKPFKPTPWHPLTILTFGYWKQGLVPRNKNQIGEEMGREVEEKLLDSRQIATELCDASVEFLNDPNMIILIRQEMQSLLKKHEDKIIDFFVPQIESSLQESLPNVLSTENLQAFWKELIAPQLESLEMRQVVAEKLSAALRARSPQFMEMLREMVREYVTQFLKNKLSFAAAFMSPDMLAGGFMSFVDWDDVKRQFENKLADPTTIQMIGDEIVSLGSDLGKWLETPEASAKLDVFRGKMQEKFRTFLAEYLRKSMPQWVEELLNSQSLWAWVENDLLSSAQNSVIAWIRTHGEEMIRGKLHISQRVQNAVEKQDVEEFYQMITHIAAQHLGAIQVLGFVLGGIVGLFQLLL